MGYKKIEIENIDPEGVEGILAERSEMPGADTPGRAVPYVKQSAIDKQGAIATSVKELVRQGIGKCPTIPNQDRVGRLQVSVRQSDVDRASFEEIYITLS